MNTKTSAKTCDHCGKPLVHGVRLRGGKVVGRACAKNMAKNRVWWNPMRKKRDLSDILFGWKVMRDGSLKGDRLDHSAKNVKFVSYRTSTVVRYVFPKDTDAHNGTVVTRNGSKYNLAYAPRKEWGMLADFLFEPGSEKWRRVSSGNPTQPLSSPRAIPSVPSLNFPAPILPHHQEPRFDEEAEDTWAEARTERDRT